MDIGYLKSLMTGAGYLKNPAPGTTWGLDEEYAWKGACLALGLRYTPYPDRNGQDAVILERIDQQTLVLPPISPPGVVSSFNLKNLLPMHVTIPEGTPAKHARLFRTQTHIPRAFQSRKDVVDPMQDMQPNISGPRTKPVRMNPEKAARLKQMRAAALVETPTVVVETVPVVEKPVSEPVLRPDVPKTIRVR